MLKFLKRLFCDHEWRYKRPKYYSTITATCCKCGESFQCHLDNKKKEG